MKGFRLNQQRKDTSKAFFNNMNQNNPQKKFKVYF